MDRQTMVSMALSLLRAALAFGAGMLVTRGVVTSEVAEALTGLILVVVPAVWGMWEKRAAEQKKQKAITEAMSKPREVWTDEQRAAMATMAGK